MPILHIQNTHNMITLFLGSIINAANQWGTNIYNQPKNQIKRLRAAGISPNAIFGGLGSPGQASAQPIGDPIAETQQMQFMKGQIGEQKIQTASDKRVFEWGEQPFVKNITSVDADGNRTTTVIKTGDTNFEALENAARDVGIDQADMSMWEAQYQNAISQGLPFMERLNGLVAQMRIQGLIFDNASAEKAALKVIVDSAKDKDGNISFWNAILIMLTQQGLSKLK